jgi:ABC-type transport system involved in cytochrome c biogenesis permease subunit
VRRGAAVTVDLANAILAYAMAGAFVLWLIGENREGSSRVLGLVAAVIVALLLIGEDREYGWWISGFVVVVLSAVGIAVALALLEPLIPGLPP